MQTMSSGSAESKASLIASGTEFVAAEGGSDYKLTASAICLGSMALMLCERLEITVLLSGRSSRHMALIFLSLFTPTTKMHLLVLNSAFSAEASAAADS